MQVEAIYRDGRVELLQPLHLKRNNVRVLVTIPAGQLQEGSTEDSVDLSAYNLSQDVMDAANHERARLDAALDAPLPPDDQLPELGVAYEERIHAYELRAQVRREQGRPA